MKLNNHRMRWQLSATALLALFANLSARADYSATVLSQGPVGYWRLDETTQPPTLPIVAKNQGTLGTSVDGTLLSDVVRGQPGAFAGNSDTSYGFSNPGWVVGYYGSRVDVPYTAALNPNGPFSVELWAKPSSAPTDLFAPVASLDAGQNSGSSREGFIVYIDGSSGNQRWQFRVGGANGYVGTASGGSFTAGAWHHVIGVYTGTNIVLYVNGQQAATANVTGTYTPNGTQPFRIGSTTIPNRGFDGSIDEVAFYGAALDANTVKAHFDAATTNAAGYATQVSSSNPLGYWRLGEPGDPPAANLGTLGSAASGTYTYPAHPGQAGPRPAAYGGFSSANNSVGFDGNGGSVTTPALNLNTNTVSITAWIKANGSQAPYAAVVLNHAGSTEAGLIFDAAGGLDVSYDWNGNNATYNWASTLSVPDSDWAFVALVVQPTEAEIYVASSTNAITFTSATNYLTHVNQAFEASTLFGTDSGTTNFFNGSIDEVAIFNRSLSAGEVYSQYAAGVGKLPPLIFANPSVPAGLYQGDSLNLSVDAGGTPNLTYQWRKGGVAINTATSSSYSNPSLASGDAGGYDVVIANAFGSVTSTVATVTVAPLTAPTISSAPPSRTLYPGGSLSLTVAASGGQLHYQWRKDNNPIAGATSSTYAVTAVTNSDAGSYTVVISNQLGTATSAPAAVVNVVVPVANSYEATVVQDGPQSWWRLGETSGTTMFDAMGRHDGYYTNSSGNAATLGVPGVARGSTDTAVSSDGTDNWFGVVPYSPALGSKEFTLECWAKVVDNASNYSPLSFYDKSKKGEFLYADSSSGTWRAAVGAGSDPYAFYYLGDVFGANITPDKWMHLVLTYSEDDGLRPFVNGQAGGSYGDFPRNAGNPLLIGGVGPSINYRFKGTVDEVAFYTYALSSNQVQAHYVAALYGTNSAPTFTLQPKPGEIVVGNEASFTGLAEGSLPISYQWLKNGSPVTGETNVTFSLGSATFGDAGTYQLQAINPVGTNLSTAVSLSVFPTPTFVNATNGLVLHLRFDGDYSDSSGRGNNASAQGSPTFVSGKIGSKALELHTDTTNNLYNYATLGAPADLSFSSNVNFSVSYWVRMPANAKPGDLPFLGSATGSANNQGLIFAPSYQAGGWQWTLNDGTINKGANGDDNSINDGAWHNVVSTFDRSAASAVTYLDGVQVDTTSIVGLGDIDTPGPFNIGQDPTGTYQESMIADLDDMGVWRRVLSPAEAQAIYYAGANGTSFDTYGPVSVFVDKAGASIVITWQAGTLVQADSINGPWTPVAGAVAPNYVAPLGTGSKFYRVKL